MQNILRRTLATTARLRSAAGTGSRPAQDAVSAAAAVAAAARAPAATPAAAASAVGASPPEQSEVDIGRDFRPSMFKTDLEPASRPKVVPPAPAQTFEPQQTDPTFKWRRPRLESPGWPSKHSEREPEHSPALLDSLSQRNFDAGRYASMLESEGFTPAQSQALLSLVEEAVNESLQASTRSLVGKDEQREAMRENEEDCERLRTEIKMLEKKDFVTLKGELERLVGEVKRIKDTMREDINRVHGGVRLDVNLEKARIRDETVDLDKLVQMADEKIDHEIADLNARMHATRVSTRTSMLRFISIILGAFLSFKISSALWPPGKKKKDNVMAE